MLAVHRECLAVVQKTEIIELFSEKGSICKVAGNYAIWSTFPF